MDPRELIPPSVFYEKAWGKQWPQHERTIYKTDISNEADPADDPADGALADKLIVPNTFQYRVLSGMREVKELLGAAQDGGDILLIREEYENLYNQLKAMAEADAIIGGFAVTGHPGIGSYEYWF